MSNENTSLLSSIDTDEKCSSIRFLSNPFRRVRSFTRSEREKFIDRRRKNLGSAALLICETILGGVENEDAGGYSAFDPYTTNSNCEGDGGEQQRQPTITFSCYNSLSIFSRKIVSTLWLRKFVKLASWALVFLSFIEPPAWCRDFSHPTDTSFVGCQGAMNAKGPPPESYLTTRSLLASTNDNNQETTMLDTDEIVDYYPNTGVLYVTREQGNYIECGLVGVILLYVLLGIMRDGCSLALYFSHKGTHHNRVLRFIRCTSTMALLIGHLVLDYKRPFRHLFRILLAISFTSGVQREFRNVARMMPEILRTLLLLFIFTFFYAWIGVMAFFGTSEGITYFPNLMEGCWTLWNCVTTANYPGAMMPGYNMTRWVSLYFVSFMIFAYFFIMNVVLAAVVNNYEQLQEEYVEQKVRKTNQNLKQAFELLKKHPQDERIDRETVMMLLVVLNEDFPQLSEIQEDEAKILFGLLDKDGTETITEEEFMEFCNVMLLEFEKSSNYKSIIEILYPNFYISNIWQRVICFINSNHFEIVIDTVLAMNAVIIAIQSYPFLLGETDTIDEHLTDGQIDTVWEGLETVFTIFYCIEMSFKILTNGWKRFSSNWRNLYDLLITTLSVAAAIYVYYPNDFSNSSIIWYITMARILRLSRLLVAIPSFQVTGKTFIDILPAVRRVFGLLFCIMYLFSTLGVILFGGMITRDPSNRLSYLLLDTDFANSGFWANNFNDLLGGMNVLFSLLVTDCAEFSIGFEAVTESKWTRLFFLSFYVVGVVFVNNVVIAVVISHFIEQWNKQQEHDKIHNVEGEATIAERRAMFNATEITGTKTGVTGDYVARVRRTSLMVGQHAVLQRAFTSFASGSDYDSSDGHNSADLEMLVEEKEQSIAEL